MSAGVKCTATIAGWVDGETWTRWRVAGAGQVRFWIKPATGPVNCGSLLCAVPVRTAGELRTACDMLAPGVYVEVEACPASVSSDGGRVRDESRPGVIFVARSASVAGFELPISHDLKDPAAAPVADAAPIPAPAPDPFVSAGSTLDYPTRIIGKMAAAGEREDAA